MTSGFSENAYAQGWDPWRERPDPRAELDPWERQGNEDGTNRDVPPWDNDPRTDDEIKQEVYDRLSDPNYDDDHPHDWEE